MDGIWGQDLCRHRDFSRLDSTDMISTAISKIPIRRAEIVKFSSLAVDRAAGTDIDEEGDKNNKPVRLAAIKTANEKTTYQTGP